MSTITKTPSTIKSSVRLGGSLKQDEHFMPEPAFLFDKENYMWMIGGMCLIFIGFFLLAGGKSPDPHKFNYEEIYSFRRITLAPIVMMAGFIVEVYAIMKKPKETATTA